MNPQRFQFIHAADIHLDSPMRGLSGYEGSAVERLRIATRDAFTNLIETSLEQQVDFIVIAGDLYDGDWRDYSTGLFFVRQMGRLAAAGIPVYLLYGNHDAASKITKKLKLPSNVRVFSADKPETFVIDALGVALHGCSYKQPDTVANLARGYPPPRDGYFNIGVLHTALDGNEGHAPYAPCTLDELINKGYDYWALGHVHHARILHQNPYVVFSGNLQGRHIREPGAKGAVVVSVEDSAVVELEWTYVDTVRWHLITVDAGGCATVAAVVDRMEAAIAAAVAAAADGRVLACRVEIVGRTDAHAALIGAHETLLVEAQAAALALGNDIAWIERVLITTEPEPSASALQAHQHTFDELKSLFADAATDRALIADIEQELGLFVSKLPPEVGAISEDPILTAAVERDYPALLSQAADYLKARLQTADS